MALGVDRDTIVKDYLLSNEYLTELIAKDKAEAAKETDDQKLLALVDQYNSVDQKYIEQFFADIERCLSLPMPFCTSLVC